MFRLDFWVFCLSHLRHASQEPGFTHHSPLTTHLQRRKHWMRRFEVVDGTSSKIWEVVVEGSTLRVRYGRIGTQGQAKDKVCASAAAPSCASRASEIWNR